MLDHIEQPWPSIVFALPVVGDVMQAGMKQAVFYAGIAVVAHMNECAAQPLFQGVLEFGFGKFSGAQIRV